MVGRRSFPKLGFGNISGVNSLLNFRWVNVFSVKAIVFSRGFTNQQFHGECFFDFQDFLSLLVFVLRYLPPETCNGLNLRMRAPWKRTKIELGNKSLFILSSRWCFWIQCFWIQYYLKGNGLLGCPRKLGSKVRISGL